MPKSSEKGIVHLLALLVLAVGIIGGLYLVTHPTIFKPKASNEGTRVEIVDNNGNIISKTTTRDVKLKFTYVVPSSKPIAVSEINFSNIAKHTSNPILLPTGGAEGDNIYNPFLIQKDDKIWMYYAGFDSTHDRIFLAESSDGINFTRLNNGNPVLDIGPTGSWDEKHSNDPIVIKVGNNYHLWYSGENNSLESAMGHATSSDGIHWQKDTVNPVLKRDLSIAWESGSLGTPGSGGLYGISPGHILYEDSVFTLWYWSIEPTDNPEFPWGTIGVGVATSTNGVNWTKYSGNPILRRDRTPGKANVYDFNGWSTPSVVKLESGYIMLAETPSFGGTTLSIATSSEGKSWQTYPNNPVLRANPSLAYEKAGVLSPGLFVIGNILYAYYSCGSTPDNTRNRICLAMVDIPTEPTSFPSHFRVANSPAFLNFAQEHPFTMNGQTIDWVLSSGSGQKTVYGQFKVDGTWGQIVSTSIKFNPPSSPMGSILADPNPCTLGVGGVSSSHCSTTISWSAPADTIPGLGVWVRDGIGKVNCSGNEIGITSASGSKTNPHITNGGQTFDLCYNNTKLDSVFVSAVSSPPPSSTTSISASPNPCTLGIGGVSSSHCSTTISWSAPTNTIQGLGVWGRSGTTGSNCSGNELGIVNPDSGTPYRGSKPNPYITAEGVTFDLCFNNTLLKSIFVDGRP